jgi:NAD(P)-dependent dehydrogenase (short-subunit alcohol dehydrogenase family)
LQPASIIFQGERLVKVRVLRGASRARDHQSPDRCIRSNRCLPRKLLPLIKDGGRIVDVSTARTRLISPGGAVYGSIKGAVEVLTKYTAKELGPRRIAVNVVATGATETDFSSGIVRDNPAVNKRVAEATALG